MSRKRDLVERQAVLQSRCALQRDELGRGVGDITQRLELVDRAALAAKRAVRNPILIALGVAAIVAIGPKRILRYAGRSALAASVARRTLGALRR